MIITITKWLITNNVVNCFAVLSSLLFEFVLFEAADSLKALPCLVNPKTDRPASTKPMVAIK